MARKPDVAYVADLSIRLLKAKAEVKRLQAEWDTLFQSSTSNTVGEPSAASEQAGQKGETNVSKMIAYLDGHLVESFTSDQIDAALGFGKKQSTATALSKLVKKEKIRKIGANQYASLQYNAPVFDLSIKQVS